MTMHYLLTTGLVALVATSAYAQYAWRDLPRRGFLDDALQAREEYLELATREYDQALYARQLNHDHDLFARDYNNDLYIQAGPDDIEIAA